MGKTTVKIDNDMRSFEFQDVFLPKSLWKELKSTADDEQLYLFGIGTKIRLAAARRLAYFSSIPILAIIGVGILLANILPDPGTGGAIALITYFIGSIFFGKVFKMRKSLNEIDKALKGSPYREQLQNFLKRKWYLAYLSSQLEGIFIFPSVWIDIIAVLLEKVFPHFAERRKGVTFAIPLGCGFDDILEISNYYKKTLWEKTEEAINDFASWSEEEKQHYIDSHTYKLNDAHNTILTPTSCSNYDSTNDRYEYKDQNGNIWYSSDNDSFYKKK